MRKQTSKDNAEFRAEVREFLNTAATADVIEAGRKTTSFFPPFEQTMKWHHILFEKGWAAIDWPVELGGTGWSAEQKRIFREELLHKRVPNLLPHGLTMVGPAIMRFGTDEQKRKYLPAILSGADFWAQGYSEPGAGSDLVALQCRADIDGEDYIINGQKIWTTYAHHANRIFLLVRTSRSGKPQEGISFLLLDRIDLPGLEIHPIIGLDGVPEQCSVFFTDVRVPRSCCLGAENDGWTVAKYLLEFERGGEGNFSPFLWNEFDSVKALAVETGDGNGGVLIDDPCFQRRLAEVEVEIAGVEATERSSALVKKGDRAAVTMSSMIKIITMETLQHITELGIEVAGLDILPWQLEALAVGSGVEPVGNPKSLTFLPKYINQRASTIFGGSSEIQRNIVAKSILQ